MKRTGRHPALFISHDSKVFTVLLGAVLTFGELALRYVRSFIRPDLLHGIEQALIAPLLQTITSAN